MIASVLAALAATNLAVGVWYASLCSVLFAWVLAALVCRPGEAPRTAAAARLLGPAAVVGLGCGQRTHPVGRELGEGERRELGQATAAQRLSQSRLPTHDHPGAPAALPGEAVAQGAQEALWGVAHEQSRVPPAANRAQGERREQELLSLIGQIGEDEPLAVGLDPIKERGQGGRRGSGGAHLAPARGGEALARRRAGLGGAGGEGLGLGGDEAQAAPGLGEVHGARRWRGWRWGRG